MIFKSRKSLYATIIILSMMVTSVAVLIYPSINRETGPGISIIQEDIIEGIWPTSGWEHSTPEEQGMNSTKLDTIMEFIESGNLGIDSIIIIRNGFVVLEEYPSALYTPFARHFLASCTKSIVSALIGIAIREGYITSIDQKMLEFFPNRTINNLDSRKENITIEHLLTMTPGFEWDQWSTDYGESNNSATQMYASDDPVQYVLDRPMRSNPGDEWVYNSGASHLLSAIIQISTEVSTLEFAETHLFDPLDISSAFWLPDSQGIYRGSSGLSLRPRDMARIGYLFLKEGYWNGDQIIPPEWVVSSSNTQVVLEDSTSNWATEGYGYQWWITPSVGVYYASGARGQKIYVFPTYNMVVVFTANMNDTTPEDIILTQMIIPSIIEYNSGPTLFSSVGEYLFVILLTPAIIAVFYGAAKIVRKRARCN